MDKPKKPRTGTKKTEKEDPEYDYSYNLRLPTELFNEIKKISKKHDRSINSQMVNMLRTWQKPSSIEERLARIEEVLLPEKLKRAAGQ